MKYDFVNKNSTLMSEWNWEKNNSINLFPDKLTCGSSKTVWWKCNKCGFEWKTKISHRNNGTGCKKCLHEKLSTSTNENNLINLYPSLCKEWNYKKNVIFPSSVYPNSNKNYWWICNKGHEWKDSPSHRILRNSSCPYCSGHRVLSGFNDLQTTHPHLMKEWDWLENNKQNILPDKITHGCHNKVSWVCSKGHRWKAIVYSRTTTNRNCPYCNKELRSSYPEKIIAFYISQIFTDTIENYKDKSLKRKEIDIYIPSIKVGIEYDGSKWHQNSKNDLAKDKICEENNIKLIRIREKGCPKYDSNSKKFYIKNKDFYELENAIYYIINVIEVLTHQTFHINIDIEKDATIILEKFLSTEKINSIVDTEIINEWNYVKNQNINPQYISIFSNRKVWWICKNNHEWQASVSHRTNGRGCPYCSGQKTLSGFNDLQSKFPIISKEWDFQKNELKPNEVNANSNKKYWWICSNCGHKWNTSVYVRTIMNCGCPECKKKAISQSSSKKVLNITTNTYYNSVKEAALKCGINPSSISNCCRGVSKTAGRMLWKYIEKD